MPRRAGPVNTVGAIAESSANASGVRACEPRIRSGAAAWMPARSGALRVPIAGQVMHGGAEIRRLAGRAVGQRGGDDAGLQTKRAQRVELVAGEHHDALWIGGHLGVTGGVADPAGRPVRVEGAGSGAQDSSGLR